MSLNVIFTWWNKQTFGTFLKTLFTGKYVGHDQFGNKYYKNKKNYLWRKGSFSSRKKQLHYGVVI